MAVIKILLTVEPMEENEFSQEECVNREGQRFAKCGASTQQTGSLSKLHEFTITHLVDLCLGLFELFPSRKSGKYGQLIFIGRFFKRNVIKLLFFIFFKIILF